MLPFRLVADYLLYRLRAFKLHGVHSPFVFDLYNQVILHDGDYYAYERIEDLREQLLQNNETLQVTDLGAGSRAGLTQERKINAIAGTSAKPAKYGQLLFRLANYFKPATLLELGTSLGITTAYLAKANANVRVYTLEGCPAIANVAKANLKRLALQHVQVVVGNIDQTLPQTLTRLDKLDLVFFDGNHRYEPTMRYFNACLARHHEQSIFVVDDIYWSAEMKQAWKEIKQHPQVKQTIDLFSVGLVFFRTTQPKEHFTLLY